MLLTVPKRFLYTETIVIIVVYTNTCHHPGRCCGRQITLCGSLCGCVLVELYYYCSVCCFHVCSEEESDY